MAILKRVTGHPAGQIIELKGDVTVIGRSPECHIVLDPNGVSRRHAEVRRVGEKFFLADLHSRNLTKVNNSRVEPGKDHPLQPGDRINICDVEFLYFTTPPKETGPREVGDVMVVTEEEIEDPNIHTLDASRSSALASAVRPEVKLKAILEITRNLSTELRIDTVAPKILDSLMELFPQAERLFLILLDPITKRLVRKAFKYRPNRRSSSAFATVPEDEIPMSISRSIVNHVLGQKKAVLSQDAGNDKNLPTSASIADLKIRSVMCVPLLTPDNQALGIIQLDTSDRKQFLQEDLDVLAAVASQAAIAVQNAAMHETLLERERMERDLKLAEQVQKRFLPQSVPKVPGFEFFAHYDPAYEVGGDYYDFVKLSNDRWAIALGDVSGKGVAAALMMAKFSGDTRFCILTEDAPGTAATELNSLLYAAGIEEKFITLSLSILDPKTRKLTLCSAGHLPILIRRAGGTVEEIGEDIAGFPLGIMDYSSYQETEITLNPGDVAVIHSDGVTDARSTREELYDSRDNRRLLKRLAESPGSAEAVGRSILQDIREFSAGHSQADDITLICFGPTAG
ncbi:SpoIIE family protein phosphatase [Singulisphaera acidiphila]|uniref:Serine phosphatase RsbU, regulator of sigma subunit n=1 Tax=Singulisphaera acidiphila (strain ATCC BAA-1392 / DSM 18658 / VKM B-2454 / MOB10) TaxID=886293 RepID=L0DGK3_SINAD|nr:SpoIIE family protein phosphatase [Singulisphaera acidiphila]AGA27806.1 serine phosphatase RsbU, regulator of sigma subunit [Singulisphaera acidiphila DSM 18658]